MKQAIGVLAAAAVIMAGVWLVLNRSAAGEYMNHGKSNAFSDGNRSRSTGLMLVDFAN